MSEKLIKSLIEYINLNYSPYDIVVLDPDEYGPNTCHMKVIFEEFGSDFEDVDIWTIYTFSGSTSVNVTDEVFKTNKILKDVCGFFNIKGTRMLHNYDGTINKQSENSDIKLVLGSFLKE